MIRQHLLRPIFVAKISRKQSSTISKSGQKVLSGKSLDGLRSRVPVPKHLIANLSQEKRASLIRTKGMSFPKAIAGAPKTKMELKDAPTKLTIPKPVNQQVVNPNKGLIKGDALTKNAAANPYLRKLLGSGKGVAQLGRSYLRAVTGGNVNATARDSLGLPTSTPTKFRKLDDTRKINIAKKLSIKRGRDPRDIESLLRQSMNQRDLAQVGTSVAVAAHLLSSTKASSHPVNQYPQEQWRYR